MKSFMLSLFLLGFGPIFINAQSITGQALLEKSIQYHDEAANDGEYIPLEGEEIINGIRFPKTSAMETKFRVFIRSVVRR